jgi:transcriptional regulator with XRE-family HTH domain
MMIRIMYVATMKLMARPDYPSVPLPSLRRYRAETGLTMAELARRAKLTAQTIMRLERGETTAQRKTVRNLARALGVSSADLMAEPGDAAE